MRLKRYTELRRASLWRLQFEMLLTFLLLGWLFSINKPWPLALGLPCRGHKWPLPVYALSSCPLLRVTRASVLLVASAFTICNEVYVSAATPVRFPTSWDSRGGSRSTWRHELWFLHRRCLRLSELPPDPFPGGKPSPPRYVH